MFAGALATVGEAALFGGAIIFVGSMIAFHTSLFLYDAFLPLQAGVKKGTALLSSLGWGIGYLGGLLCMGLLYPLLQDAKLPEAAANFRWSFLIVAGFYLVFSLPTIVYLKDPQTVRERPLVSGVKSVMGAALKQALGTLQTWRPRREVFKFMFGFYLVNDGLTTLVYFTSIFAATTLEMSINQILLAFFIVQVVGAPATIVAGVLAERVG